MRAFSKALFFFPSWEKPARRQDNGFRFRRASDALIPQPRLGRGAIRFVNARARIWERRSSAAGNRTRASGQELGGGGLYSADPEDPCREDPLLRVAELAAVGKLEWSAIVTRWGKSAGREFNCSRSGFFWGSGVCRMLLLIHWQLAASNFAGFCQ